MGYSGAKPWLCDWVQVESLVDMGFTRERAVEALGATGNDLQAATNILLVGH